MAETHVTKDWIEASLLFASDLPLDSTSKTNGVCFFSFKKPKQAEKIINDYNAGNLTVNARKFVDSQRRVKDIVHR